MIDEVKILLSVVGGALSTTLLFYFKLRSMNIKLCEQQADLDNKIKERNDALEAKKRKDESEQHKALEIDKEAAWKRILDMREAEIVKLQNRDDAQEKKIDDLMDKHIQCQRNEAAVTERVKSNEDRMKFLEEKILNLLQLALTRVQSNDGQNHQQGSSGTEAR